MYLSFMNRTFNDRDSLTADEVARFYEGHCPDCETPRLLEGPSGGGSVNVYCGNEASCGSKFNYMGPFGVDRISAASPNKPRVRSTPYRD